MMGAMPRLAGALLACTLAGAASAATLEEIVAKHVEARGGREALRSLSTVRMKGRASAGPGRVAIVTREIARPGRIRTEFVFQGTRGVFAWDGASGFRVSPLDGAFSPEPLPAEQAAEAAEQADVEGPLVDWKAKGHTVELVRAASPGNAEHELQLTLRTGGVRRLWLDAASGQIVRMELTRLARGRPLLLRVDFSDFRETQAIRFPRTIEIGARERPTRLRIVVDEVEANVPMDEARFRLPG
jgi:outer membrane lipoprotein-sorting protein